MFLVELDQRSGRLAAAADAVALGDIAGLDLTSLRRDAHTIKGTARVMGYVAIGSGAEVLESAWDAIAPKRSRPDPIWVKLWWL